MDSYVGRTASESSTYETPESGEPYDATAYGTDPCVGEVE